MNLDAHFSLPILSFEECRLVQAQLAYLRPYWIERSELTPFFTLGAAAYMDARVGGQYEGLVAQLNPVLRQNFSWLYRRVLNALSELLDAPVRLDDRTAFPGFHIFLPHPVFELPLMSVHYDLQFDLISWNALNLNVDKRSHCSFTLSISLPSRGGGLNLWELEYDASHDVDGGIQTYASNHTPQKIEYRIGELFFHSGYRLHQIAASQKLEHADARITLQGHAICDEQGWILYW